MKRHMHLNLFINSRGPVDRGDQGRGVSQPGFLIGFELSLS
jgi:hypothetical protein